MSLVTIHPPSCSRDRRIAVFYLHGGGLVYGERDDLPAPYVRMLAEAGYTLIAADYPLAPETPLPGIIESVFGTWREEVAVRIDAGELAGYALLGRSSGGYLALALAREIARRRGAGADGALPRPLGVLDFYGYHDLTDPSLTEPARAYTALPRVTRDQVDRLAGQAGRTVTSGPKALRYALYVHVRQETGAWLRLLGLDGDEPGRDARAFSLGPEDIAALPPLFICASTGDEDIPYRIPKALFRTVPDAVMKTVYDLPHDFDRDASRPEGPHIWAQAIAWLDGLA